MLVLGSARGLLPARQLAHPDAAALDATGWRHGLARWEGIRLSALAVTAMALGMLGAPPALAVGAALAPSVWVRLRLEHLREAAHRAVPAMVTATEADLRSGLPLPVALRRALDAAGNALGTRPFREALRSYDLGRSLDSALEDAASSAADREREVLLSLALGVRERLPRERLAVLLASLVERAAFEDRLDDEIRARAAGARMQQWLLAALVPGLAAYLALSMPLLATTLGSDLGRYVLIPAAGALEVAGILLGRRVVSAASR